MPSLMPRVLVALLLSAASVEAQVADTTTTAHFRSPAPVTLQDFTASLGVTVPWGQLVRNPASTPPVVRSWVAPTSLRPGASVSPIAPPAVDTLQCPMPIARVDTATLSPMPVALPTADLPIAGQLKGCENPLRSR